MKRLLLAPLLVLLCAPILDGRAALPEVFATPQDTISSYWHRMIEQRHQAALECFVDGDASEIGNMLALPDLVELRCRDFRLSYRGDGMVDVRYTIEYRIAMGDSLAHFGSGDRLSLTSSGWKIARPILFAAK